MDNNMAGNQDMSKAMVITTYQKSTMLEKTNSILHMMAVNYKM